MDSFSLLHHIVMCDGLLDSNGFGITELYSLICLDSNFYFEPDFCASLFNC